MEKSSFFNSVSGDRKYKAEDWASYFASFIGNGVFPVPSTGLQVVAGNGMHGGIVDSIPLQRAITDGCTRNVVVLTRNRGYRKDSKDIRIPSFVYRKYPKLREALSRRCAVYNEQLEMVERMEDEGQIIVIRPLKPVAVDRIEKDVQKLTEFYQEGYECARALLEE